MPQAPDLRTSLLRRELLPVLLWREIAEGIGRALFVEEANVLINLCRYVVRICNVEIREHFGLDPSIDGLHGRIIRGSACSGHGSGDIVHRQEFVKLLEA